MKSAIFFGSFLLLGLAAAAQDSSKKKEVNVTSAFKPTLKEAAKINMNATPPAADTTRPRLQYNIPNQNLSLAFQPGSLKPLALDIDSGGKWDNDSYVKLGYGNFSTPFLQAGFSAGDGRNTGLNVFIKHSSSKGEMDHQDYKSSAVDLAGFVKTSSNLQWNGRVGGRIDEYNKYGAAFKIPGENADSIETNYQTWRSRLSVNNINRTELGLSWSPEIKIDAFKGVGDGTENNVYVNAPIRKYFNAGFGVDVAVAASFSRYKQHSKSAITNNYYTFSPSLLFKKTNVNIQAGLRPSWDRKEFHLLPNLMLEFNTPDNRFAVHGGWTADYRNSGYQYTASMNPWIWAPSNVRNTRIEERFVGMKGTLSDHFSFSARAGSNVLYNQPLYVNDTATGRSFNVIYESRIKQANLTGELAYTVGEKFSLISNLSVSRFSPDSNDKAWGLLPMEWKTTMNLQVMKDLYVNSTLYAFDGPWALTKSGEKNLPAAMDFSAGLEFRVWKYIKVWGQFNNIFNKDYQRWNQYPVYGFNFLAGVVFSFAQTNK